MSLTCRPTRVSQWLRGLEPCFHHRHQLIFSWLLVLHLIDGERANLKALARHGPGHLAYHHDRRLLGAAYWCTKSLLWWFADQALQALPPPEDGLLYLVGDSTLKGKRGHTHPLAQKTRLSQHQPSVFGFRIVRLMAPWDVYRMPVDVALLRRTPAHRRSRLPTRTRPVAPEAARFPASGLVPGDRGRRRCRLRLAGQSGPAPDPGLRVRRRPPPSLEIGQWQGAQSAGDPLAALEIDPDSESHGHHPTSSDLVGLGQTGAVAPSGRRHGGPQQAAAKRWAETDQHPRDQSARDRHREGDRGRVSAPVVGGAAGERVEGRGRYG